MNPDRMQWRLLDTGLRSATENIALNRALLEARAADEIPSTLRFLRFTPCALIGFHQSVEQELDALYCSANHIDMQRRITGGGAIFLDSQQLGWELYLHKRDIGTVDMQAIAKKICEAAAVGISALGVSAQFRPRNDIEVDGKKISGTGGAFDGDAIMYQGTLLIHFDVEEMLRVLKIPTEKLRDKAIESARERVSSLTTLLGSTPQLNTVKASLVEAFGQAFGISFYDEDLTPGERVRLRKALEEIGSDDWVRLLDRDASEMPVKRAVRKFPGGMLRVALSIDLRRQRLKQLHFSGDVFVHPQRTLVDLEAALRDSALERLDENVATFFAQGETDLFGLTPSDFAAVIHEAMVAPEAATI